MMDLSDYRKDYLQDGLEKKDLLVNPFDQFELWFKKTVDLQLNEPNAFSLATVDQNGSPGLRTVLLKYFDERGFVFFTNYSSAKAQQIKNNPQVAALFPWVSLERQIIITGKAEKITKSESLKYFVSRPHGSQLGAWISQQSSVISSRSILEMKLEQIKNKFKKGQVPLPDFWGGYRIVPHKFEFWQGRTNRLHDRFVYQKNESDNWKIERLAP